MEQYIIYLKKFKTASMVAIGGLIIFAVLVAKIIPFIYEEIRIESEIKMQTGIANDTERKLADLKSAAAKKEEESSHVIKEFFKPIDSGLDVEAIMSDEFGEILKLIKENKIKMRSIKYDYNSGSDIFVKNGAGQFSSCVVDIEMISNYASFKNFLKDLYRHEHFLDISKVEIVPYEKNKKILLISFQIKLYARNEGSFAPPPSAPEPAQPQETQPAPATASTPEEF